MKFHVSKTSLWHNEQPCEEAVSEAFTMIDKRVVADPSILKLTEDWYGRGHNHRVENGHIKRDLIRQGWFIELADLDALCQFIDKYGRVIVERDYDNRETFSVEIYDDYRE